MPFNKVCVDRLYQKTGSPNEKKARHVQQIADDIFADLFASPVCREQNASKRTGVATRPPSPVLKKVSFVLTLMSCLVMACAEKPMGSKEEQAIKLVQGHTLGQGYFSVVSNVAQKAQDARLAGNTWSQQSWQAGLPSQTDRLLDTFSQYFNIFEAPGRRWVRLTYTDKNGAHEAVWEVDIYSKQVSPHDTLAQELILPPNTEKAVLPADLTGPGTFAGGD